MTTVSYYRAQISRCTCYFVASLTIVTLFKSSRDLEFVISTLEKSYNFDDFDTTARNVSNIDKVPFPSFHFYIRFKKTQVYRCTCYFITLLTTVTLFESSRVLEFVISTLQNHLNFIESIIHDHRVI